MAETDFQFTTFSYPILIRENHLDTFGHVNNATYLQIFEEARWEIVAPRGFDLKSIQQKMQGPIILEVQIKFLKELSLRKQVFIKTKAISYEGKVGHLKQWIEDENQQIYCEAIFKIGLFDLRSRKLITPTQEWLHAVGVFIS